MERLTHSIRSIIAGSLFVGLVFVGLALPSAYAEEASTVKPRSLSGKAPAPAVSVPAEIVLDPPIGAVLPKLDGTASYRALAKTISAEQALPSELVDAVMYVESNYNPLASGNDGEVGLMQIMPPTARMLGFSGSNQQLADPETNIRLGTRYLAEAWRLADQDICTTVMKYRAGWREKRFSVLSVRYCERVRAHLVSVGYPVTGLVPLPTFGFRTDEFHQGVQLGSIAAKRRLASGKKLRSRVAWGNYDARMKELDRKSRISLGQ